MALEPSSCTIFLTQTGGKRHDASQGTNEIVQLDDGSLALQQSPRNGTGQSLGLLHIDSSSLAFEAVAEHIKVAGPYSTELKSQTKFFNCIWLDPRKSDGPLVVVLLRPGDTIFFSRLKTEFTVDVEASKVQVDSSLPPEAAAGFGTDNTEHHAPVAVMSSTAQQGAAYQNDQVTASKSMQQTSKNPSRSTPLPSAVESQVVQETPALESRHTERLRTVSTSNNSLFVGDEESETEDTEHENAREESGVTRSSLHHDRGVPRGTVDSRLREASKSGPKGVGVSDRRITGQTVGSNEVEERSPTPRTDSEVPLPAGDRMSDDDNDTTPEESYRTAQNHVGSETPAGTIGTTSNGADDERDDHDDEDSDIPYRKRAKRDKVESQDSLRSIVAVEIPRRRAPTSHVTPKPQGRKLSDISEASGLATTNAAQRTPSSTASNKSLNASLVAGRYSGPAPRVVFSGSSGVPKSVELKKFFKSHGGSLVDAVTETGCNFFCVGNGKLAKTGKLLLSIAFGKQIVTDAWFTESLEAGHLLDPQLFLPADPEREKEWGFRMSDTVGTDRRNLFAGKRLYVTPSLKKDYGSGYKEIEEVARVAGADRIVSMPARDLKRNDKTIILALENGDLDGVKLNEDGHRCYHKDLLSVSILRGRLDLDSDEFLINPSSSQAKKTPKRKRST